MPKLVERERVKDCIGMARADSIQDDVLNSMILQASEQVEQITRRTFTKGAHVEYHESYDQPPSDPDGQFLWIKAPPIDTVVSVTIVWSPNDDHDANGTALKAATDFRVDGDTIFVKPIASGSLSGSAAIFALSSPHITWSPTGFKVTYTGGFAILNPTPVPDPTPDPLDDYDIVSVPQGLKDVIARKVATDWKDGKMIKPWTGEQKGLLLPWKRRNVIG